MKNSTIHNYLHPENKTLGNLLTKLALFKHWNEILRSCLGDEAHIMDHCHIVNMSQNSLIVITNSPNWVTRLRFHIPDLLPKLRQHKGLEHVRAICCKAQPNIQHKKVKKNIRNRLLLKPETASLIRESAKNMGDVKIKAILEKIASYAEK